MTFGILIVKRSFAAANAIAIGKIATRRKVSTDIIYTCTRSTTADGL
jgi:hypothetical protein